MAGANMNGGTPASTQEVPAIGGAAYRAKEGLPTSVPVAASAHLGSDMRAEGVNYDTNQSVGVKLDTGAYPSGTAMKDRSPGDDVN